MKKELLIVLLLFTFTGNSLVGEEKPNISILERVEVDGLGTIDPISGLEYVEIYANEVPKTIKFDEKYKGGHPELLDYAFVRASNGKIRKLPNAKSEVIREAVYKEKLKVLAKVKDYIVIWYKVELPTGEIGYIYEDIVIFRTFKFQEAMNEIVKLESFIDESNKNNEKLLVVNSYVPNPDNKNMVRKKDKYGVALDQNIIAKYKDQVIHLPDSSIVKMIEKYEGSSKIKAAWYPEEYFIVENKNIKTSKVLATKAVNKAVVIDATNQNLMLFEKINSEWNIISYVYSKTGDDSQLGFETPRGYFLTPVTKYTMWYNSPVKEDSGLAKYATRFTGGAYLHGTPVGNSEKKYRAAAIKSKEKHLGTYSGTRKCVRTTEQHAKFIFDWILEGKKKTRENEQKIDENILFVVI